MSVFKMFGLFYKKMLIFTFFTNTNSPFESNRRLYEGHNIASLYSHCRKLGDNELCLDSTEACISNLIYENTNMQPLVFIITHFHKNTRANVRDIISPD